MAVKVVNKYKEPYDVYIGRGSRWGNPYSHLDGTKASFKVDSRDEAVKMYGKHLADQVKAGEVTVQDLAELDGKTLGCFCKPKSCHGDVIKAAVKWAVKQTQEN